MGGKRHSCRHIHNPNIQLFLAKRAKESRSATNCTIIGMSTNKEHNKDDDARRPSRSRTTPTAAAAAAVGQGSASSSSAPSPPPQRRRGRQDLVGTHYRLATETHMDRYAQQHLAAAYPELGIPRQPQRPPRRGRRPQRRGQQQPRRVSSSDSGGSNSSSSGSGDDAD